MRYTTTDGPSKALNAIQDGSLGDKMGNADIFFVISGYLITTIILTEKEQGTFSLINFYERRARRILPALFLVMLVSLPFAWIWLLPSDMKDFSQSLVAVSTFMSNILFWRETGYWGAENELKPLLHTWSLAVEEQYYLLFPLFLLLMWKFRKKYIFISFVFVAILSLLICQWGAYNKPTANFFLLPTRGWELALGAILSFIFIYMKKNVDNILSFKFFPGVMAFVGLLMVIFSVFYFDKNTPFPSSYTLVPVVGTFFILFFSNEKNFVGKILGSKFLVSVGLVSYSAYLWHQPVFSLFRHKKVTDWEEVEKICALFLVFFLSYFSWRYIERIFRNKRVISRKTIFSLSLTFSVLFIFIGVLGHKTDGFAYRENKNGLNINLLEQKIIVNHGLSEECEGEFTLSEKCRTSANPEILVWGDSNAMHLVQGILASNPDAKIIQITKSVCGPFFDLAPIVNPTYTAGWAKGCLEFTGKVKDYLKQNESVKYVVMSSPFRQYMDKNNLLLFRDGRVENPSIEKVSTELKNTLKEITNMNKKPVIFSPPPESGNNIGKCLVKSDWLGGELDACNFKKDEILERKRTVYDFLEQINQSYPVVMINDLVCKNGDCITHVGSTYIFRDDKGHLSQEGSAILGKEYDFYRLITTVE